MCDSFGFLSKWFNNTCLGALYMQRFKLVQSLCKFKVVPLKEQVYQVRKGQFLVYSTDTSTAMMRCRNGSHSEIHLQKGTQQVWIPPGCQGFFLDHLATSDYSVRLASEVLHFNWEWDPLTFLPAGEIKEMGRTLKNLSALHLHHPDLVELQYLTRLHGAKNASAFGLGRLDLGLQELTGSVSAYFTSFGTGMEITIMLILITLIYLNCQRADGPSPTYAPAAGPVIVQAPAAAPALTAPPVPAPRGSPQFPYFPMGRCKRRHWGRSCCGPDASDDDFTIRYRTDREEMLRDRYNYNHRPGTDPRSHPQNKPSVQKVIEDSGTKLPCHHELHDHLRSILNGTRLQQDEEEEP